MAKKKKKQSLQKTRKIELAAFAPELFIPNSVYWTRHLSAFQLFNITTIHYY